MSFHIDFQRILNKLDYKNSIGWCHGFSMRWIEACILNEEPEFHRRVAKIISYGDNLLDQVNKTKEKKDNT